ncbi:MAG: hypothetical protein Q9209_003355 [Squamulea sp. 1 TL-2023]
MTTAPAPRSSNLDYYCLDDVYQSHTWTPPERLALAGEQGFLLPIYRFWRLLVKNLERVQLGIYAQCKLARWVELDDLEILGDSDTGNATFPERPLFGETEQWWLGFTSNNRMERSTPIIQPINSSPHKVRCDLRMPGYISAKSVSILEGKPLARQTEPPAPLTKGCKATQSQEAPSLALDNSLQDPDGLLKSIKSQYMQSLYRSKASLAYFAKGPLSRARAGVSGHGDESVSRHRLIEQLRALIIPLNVLDQKYREALPCLIKDLPTANVSDDERNEVAAKYKKPTRKSRKDKVGKNGLYPEEELDILSWWLEFITSVPAYDSLELMTEATLAMVLEQRTRETLLQIILMLEVLALETTIPNDSLEQCRDKEPWNYDLPRKQSRTKKPQNVNLLLDLSVDRLCIWQSMAVEKNQPSSKKDGVGIANTGKDPSSQKEENSLLRDFCVDKLGGPLSHSPARPALRRVGSSSLKTAKAGAATKRPQLRQARRTLERVLTDDKTSRKPTLSLLRSATDSVVPSLKREPSEVSLCNVPVIRPTLRQNKRYSQREVDLTAVSHAKEAKMKKQAEVEQELQGAIAALKKPNPRMAVKELIESAERRATGVKSRKSQNPVRHPFAQSVQIMATPSARRRRDVYASQTSRPQKSMVIEEDLDEIPPSSCIRVPGSLIKPWGELQMTGSSTRPPVHLMPTVEQTPTRGPCKFFRSNTMPNAIQHSAKQASTTTPSSATVAGHSSSIPDTGRRPVEKLRSSHLGVHGTPSKTTSTGTRGNLPRSGIEDTPTKQLKPVSANAVATSSKITSSPIPKGGDVSIYESLGWDDDVDELL